MSLDFTTLNNLTAWLLAGASLGSVVGLSLIADGQRRVLQNIAVATLGSAIGGVVVCPWLGISAATSDTCDSRALVVSLISTLLFLAFANLARDPRASVLRTTDTVEK